MSTTAVTLYTAETELAALADTEGAVPEDQITAFFADLAEAKAVAVAKRDSCIRFRLHLESQIAFVGAEQERLRKRRTKLETGLAKFDQYVMDVIEGTGKKTLEGNVGDFVMKDNPSAVNIVNEIGIPLEYTNVTISFSMPASRWYTIINTMPALAEDKRVKVTTTPDKTAIKKAIQAHKEVPGADLSFSSRLEVK